MHAKRPVIFCPLQRVIRLPSCRIHLYGTARRRLLPDLVVVLSWHAPLLLLLLVPGRTPILGGIRLRCHSRISLSTNHIPNQNSQTFSTNRWEVVAHADVDEVERDLHLLADYALGRLDLFRLTADNKRLLVLVAL